MNAIPVIDMTATGRNIVFLRKRAGLTVRDLQAIFGFANPQAIYKWQRGETLPSTDNLLALGFILGEPIEKILVFQTIEKTEPQDNSCGSCLFGFILPFYNLFCFNRPESCTETFPYTRPGAYTTAGLSS